VYGWGKSCDRGSPTLKVPPNTALERNPKTSAKIKRSRQNRSTSPLDGKMTRSSMNVNSACRKNFLHKIKLLMRIAVTGSSGKVGQYVVEHLANAGYEVIGISRQVPASQDKLLQFRKLDLRTPGNAQIALSGVQAVVHLAAIPAPGQHQNEIVFANNTSATYNILEAASELSIKRVIVASSIAILGFAYSFLYPEQSLPLHYFPVDELHPLTPIDAYGLSKLVDEDTCASFVLRSNLEIIALRFSWITFPNDYLNIIRSVGNTDRMSNIFWSYVDIQDVSQSIEKSLAAKFTGFHPIYITADDTLSNRNSIELIQEFYPQVTKINPGISGHNSLFSTKSASNLIDYQSCFSWRNINAIYRG